MMIWLRALINIITVLRRNQLYMLRKAALGDVLWVEPVLRELALQNREIIFITDFPCLYENFPFSNVRIVPNDNKLYKRTAKMLHWLGLRRYVIYLNNTYEKQPDKHFLHVYQQAAGLPQTEEYPKLYVSEAEREKYQNLPPYAVIHLETTSPHNHRQVYGIDWAQIISYLKEKNITPYFIAKNPDLYQLPNYKKLDSIRDMVAFLSSAQIFIGVDSGPSHVASSLQIPSIIFFGSINPWYRHFENLWKGIIMQQSCRFANCYHRPQGKKKDYSCLVVGKDGVPGCCVFSDTLLQKNIDQLLAMEPVEVKAD